MFSQMEGLVVDEGITLCDLKGMLDMFVQRIFGEQTKTRLRPSYFPFTEPSVEVDVSCFQCGGKGCRLCKETGWIEVLGAGVVNKKVLENCGIDSNKYSGFAFGLGLERIAMLKYGINNIKMLLSLICVCWIRSMTDQDRRIRNACTVKLVKRLCRY